MFEPTSFGLFIAAALLIAVSPGPGILYVAARTLAAGRAQGMASSFGTALGGMVHIIGSAIGLSALLLASAEAFMVLKLIGAAYLIWIGVKTLREARTPLSIHDLPSSSSRKAFREGVVVEVFNPKTAAFFLAFIPQFVDPAAGDIALQFIVLGTISVTLNTLVDVIVALAASKVRHGVARRPALIQRLRQGSGLLMCGLGVSLALARRPT